MTMVNTCGDRTLDPIFALSIGVAAAAVRINREEKEKGRSREQTVESLKRRINLALGRETKSWGES